MRHGGIRTGRRCALRRRHRRAGRRARPDGQARRGHAHAGRHVRAGLVRRGRRPGHVGRADGGHAAIASGASLTLDQAGDAANASRYSGAGALIKTGGGMLTLNADSSATGSTVIAAAGCGWPTARSWAAACARGRHDPEWHGPAGRDHHRRWRHARARQSDGCAGDRGRLRESRHLADHRHAAAQSRLDVGAGSISAARRWTCACRPTTRRPGSRRPAPCADLQAGRRRGRGQFRQRAQSAVVHGRQRQQHGRRRQRRHAQPDAQQQAGGQSRQHRQSAGRGDGHRRLAANP